MQKLTGVAYARYSSDKQQESSITVQLFAIRRFCEANNIELIHEYIDEAQTGTNANRKQFQQMMKGAPDKEFKLVIVHMCRVLINRLTKPSDFVIICKQVISLKGAGSVLDSSTIGVTKKKHVQNRRVFFAILKDSRTLWVCSTSVGRQPFCRYATFFLIGESPVGVIIDNTR